MRIFIFKPVAKQHSVGRYLRHLGLINKTSEVEKKSTDSVGQHVYSILIIKIFVVMLSAYDKALLCDLGLKQ